eukprot:g26643.t1
MELLEKANPGFKWRVRLVQDTMMQEEMYLRKENKVWEKESLGVPSIIQEKVDAFADLLRTDNRPSSYAMVKIRAAHELHTNYVVLTGSEPSVNVNEEIYVTRQQRDVKRENVEDDKCFMTIDRHTVTVSVREDETKRYSCKCRESETTGLPMTCIQDDISQARMTTDEKRDSFTGRKNYIMRICGQIADKASQLSGKSWGALKRSQRQCASCGLLGHDRNSAVCKFNKWYKNCRLLRTYTGEDLYRHLQDLPLVSANQALLLKDNIGLQFKEDMKSLHLSSVPGRAIFLIANIQHNAVTEAFPGVAPFVVESNPQFVIIASFPNPTSSDKLRYNIISCDVLWKWCNFLKHQKHSVFRCPNVGYTLIQTAKHVRTAIQDKAATKYLLVHYALVKWFLSETHLNLAKNNYFVVSRRLFLYKESRKKQSTKAKLDSCSKLIGWNKLSVAERGFLYQAAAESPWKPPSESPGFEKATRHRRKRNSRDSENDVRPNKEKHKTS